MKAIAIDGPAGSGKSTIARLLAKKLKIQYLDTGAMYRAVTWYLMEKKVDIDDEKAIEESLSAFQLEIEGDQFFVNKKNVTHLIRSDSVTENVSKVSAYSAVRNFLLGFQQEEARKSFHVLEGRDIGTKVLPDADLKIFLTASPEVRAHRRRLDKESSSTKTYEETLKAIVQRDEYDSKRKISPLKKAPDALLLDTSAMSADEVVEAIYQLWIDRQGLQ